MMVLFFFFTFLVFFVQQVADLKTKIEESREDHGAARQKLIHAGKVLKDEQLISELGIAESDFIVCMITKEIAKVGVLILSTLFPPMSQRTSAFLLFECRNLWQLLHRPLLLPLLQFQ